MHRVISLQTGQNGGVPFGFVSKRICCSAMFSMGLLAFIGGFILGRYAWDREQMLRPYYRKSATFSEEHEEGSVLQNLLNSCTHHANDIIKPSNKSIYSNEDQAHLIAKYFTELGFDSVSLKPSTVLLSYYDRRKPNKVSIMDNNNSEVERFYNSESAYFEITDGLHVSNVIEDTVVYINFGQDSDYEYLKKMEIDVRNRIVLARLGRVSPITLVDNALKRNAKGVILFADPQQYPITDNHDDPLLWPYQLGLLQVLHGNPTTKMRNNETKKKQSRNACVPVQMIKSQDAQQILLKMSSNNQSHKSWLGDLKSTTYPMGPGFSTQDYRLRLEVNAVNVEREFFSVMAAIRGSTEPDRYVLLGSDSQMLASHSNYSLEGVANMMELARVLSNMKTSLNWKPRRTVVFCSWGVPQAHAYFHDPPLEYSEHPNLLGLRTVAYIGVNVAIQKGSQRFRARGTPLLFQLMYNASSMVPYASSKTSLYDVWLQETVNTSTFKYPTMESVITEEDLQTILYDRGIPSIHFQFPHSEGWNMDDWTENKDTPQKSSVQLWGALMWKLADSIVLPFNVREYADFLNRSVVGIQTKFEKIITSQSLPLFLLHNAVKNFSEVAEAFQEKLNHIKKTNTLEIRMLNDQLMQLEGAFVHHSTTRRSRHTVLSPGDSISNDMSLGFGSLQDQLNEISFSPIAAELRANISHHIMDLVQCIKSAMSVLQDPLTPLTYN